jgi:AcrR family transcriptional regulator
MTDQDRRVQRTRARLQRALIDLISERPYDAITIQEIVDRADVGRTTFYAHFQDKEALFLSCHESILGGFHHPHSKDQLLATEPPPGMPEAYRHLAEARTLFDPIFQGREVLIILRQIRDSSARQILTILETAFSGMASKVPLDMLANYLAGAQLALVQWWLENRQPYSPEELARTFHTLQRAAIRDAFGLDGP